MQLGQWIRRTRKDKDLTMEECAARAGVGQSVWSEWENENRQRRPATIKKIAKGLGVPATEALEVAGYHTEPKAEYSELWIGLSPSQKRLVYSAAKAFREALLSNNSATAGGAN